jgi:isoleucyl-tRNA synthetase
MLFSPAKIFKGYMIRRNSMTEKKDYRETLNLPQTDFPMRANLPNREPEFIKKWDKINIYNKIREARKESPTFCFHDGPPYANGDIHIGHALNKILKDIIVKSKTLQGFNTTFQPGWDCHGLPIELKVDGILKDKKKDMTVSEIHKACKEYALSFVKKQAEDFKRLGVFAEWDNPYLTLTKDYEAEIIRQIGKLFENGYVYKGLKPVNWCASCVTALAEAEVEYDNHKSPSVYVKFPFKGKLEDFEKEFFVVIWTTTPWTLPANLAISLHPDFNYGIYKANNNEHYLIAVDLAENFQKECNFESLTLIKELKGSDLDNKKCSHPFLDKESLIINGTHVTLEQGTGCVHTAPGHGMDDYIIGQKYNLPVYVPVDDKGCFTKDFSLMEGEHVFKANPKVVELLKEKGMLIKEQNVEHSYPHCWRCKKPIIFRGTAQWFIAIDANNLRETALEEIKKVNWIPAWGEERIHNMIAGRPDWCISRQRKWGVPITVAYCKKCGEVHSSKELFENAAKLVEKEGAASWFTEDIHNILPKGTVCEKCGSDKFIKETDILDVWIDSGVSHRCVLGKRNDQPWPADLYIEGSDQYRGWFHSSLLTAVANDKQSPYKTVITHGFVLDGKGNKMSKSKGNVVAPQKIVKQYGAEILRLWVSQLDYKDDVRISDEIIKRSAETYRKIRNTSRYLLSNLFDFNPDKDSVNFENMLPFDKYALSRLTVLNNKVIDSYDKYEFHTIYHSVLHFCTVEMSNFYLDVIKDRLYCSKQNSIERRSAQTVLFEMAKTLAVLISPILTFTADEIWEHLPEFNNKAENVHLNEFSKLNYTISEKETKMFETLLEVREVVLKELETARQKKVIGHPLDAHIKLSISKETKEKLASVLEELNRYFIVSLVSINDTEGEIKVTVEKAQGEKCERCWNYANLNSDNLCKRCEGVVN